MKRILLLLLLMVVLSVGESSIACIGRTLTIGIVNTPREHLLAELISVLVTERTGTMVNIARYRNSSELYAAVHKGDVGLMIETVQNAMAVVGSPDKRSPQAAVESVKKEYGAKLNLVWLEQFGDDRSYAPVVAVDVLEKMPVLPKLVDKLAGILKGDSGTVLMESAEGKVDLHQLARDFLKRRKLI